MKEYNNEQGECPKCHGYNLDYDPASFEDNQIYFNWHCKDCGQEGSEWYNMEFIGHNIINEDGKEIQL